MKVKSSLAANRRRTGKIAAVFKRGASLMCKVTNRKHKVRQGTRYHRDTRRKMIR